MKLQNLLNEHIKRINTALATSTCTADCRQGMITATDVLLHDIGAYKGFSYLYPHEVVEGHLPGRKVGLADGDNTQFEGTDETRIRYSLPY